jgi:multisubunit Na+/H+ antiporter MnhE subunit
VAGSLTARSVPGRLVAGAVVAALTAVEMALGSWRVVVACLRGPTTAGPVEIPRAGRTDADNAIWGLLTGEAPDEIVLDVDEDRDVLRVHLIDASDPDAVRERHRRMYLRWLRRLTR